MNSQSLNRIAWSRFKKDKMAIVSLFFIRFLFILSVIPYVFMTDKTEYAGEMNLDLSTLPPFSSISILTIDEDVVFAKNVNEKRSGVSYDLISSSEHIEYVGTYSHHKRIYYFGTDKFR